MRTGKSEEEGVLRLSKEQLRDSRAGSLGRFPSPDLYDPEPDTKDNEEDERGNGDES